MRIALDDGAGQVEQNEERVATAVPHRSQHLVVTPVRVEGVVTIFPVGHQDGVQHCQRLKDSLQFVDIWKFLQTPTRDHGLGVCTLIGTVVNSVLDARDAALQLRRFTSGKCAITVFTRRYAVDSFEVSDEVALVGAADTSDDLFNTEKSGSEQGCCLLHS